VNVRPSGLFEFDTMLLKLTPAGELVWQRAYSALEIVDARGGVAVAPDGSVYIAGTGQDVTRSGDATNDGILLKFSADGDLLWDRSWDGRDGDTARASPLRPTGRSCSRGTRSPAPRRATTRS
jgi:outer membrane protein assembly factor BamB